MQLRFNAKTSFIRNCLFGIVQISTLKKHKVENFNIIKLLFKDFKKISPIQFDKIFNWSSSSSYI